ncbi:MAG: hypothetical protein L0Y66_14410 [Myxococcaceae bacterium]|nr:hypothetical protein [Myxococcaceae bacterium]MCI0673669.1 hypothetical protein [Myxococcaceae bacterium]
MRLVVVLLMLAAPAARAADVRLILGADYWVDPQRAVFPLMLGVGAQASRALELGGRFGALITTSPNKVGVPLDFVLRVEVPRSPLYIEGLVGPWLIFDDGDLVRAHAGVGFGARLGAISLGLEAAYLTPSGSIGLRVGFEL